MSASKNTALDKLTVIASFIAVAVSVFSLMISLQQNNENKAIVISEARVNICLSFAQSNFARALEIEQFMSLNNVQTDSYQKSVDTFRENAVKYQQSAGEVINCLKDNDDKRSCATKVLVDGFDGC